jgi:hypothetical protein
MIKTWSSFLPGFHISGQNGRTRCSKKIRTRSLVTYPATKKMDVDNYSGNVVESIE